MELLNKYMKLLPKTSKNPKGFTLIELLVVISIIAVLALIGATIYSGVQSRARDARRQADAIAIAKAYEAQKVPGSTSYPVILTTWFAGGAIPTEPAGYPPLYSVCGTTTVGAATVVRPTVWGAASITPTCPAGSTAYHTGQPTATPPVAASLPPTGLTSFQVCVLLENGTAPNIFCKGNVQ